VPIAPCPVTGHHWKELKELCPLGRWRAAWRVKESDACRHGPSHSPRSSGEVHRLAMRRCTHEVTAWPRNSCRQPCRPKAGGLAPTAARAPTPPLRRRSSWRGLTTRLKGSASWSRSLNTETLHRLPLIAICVYTQSRCFPASSPKTL